MSVTRAEWGDDPQMYFETKLRESLHRVAFDAVAEYQQARGLDDEAVAERCGMTVRRFRSLRSSPWRLKSLDDVSDLLLAMDGELRIRFRDLHYIAPGVPVGGP